MPRRRRGADLVVGRTSRCPASTASPSPRPLRADDAHGAAPPPHPLGQRQERGPHPLPPPRRGRLRGQAVQPGGADGADRQPVSGAWADGRDRGYGDCAHESDTARGARYARRSSRRSCAAWGRGLHGIEPTGARGEVAGRPGLAPAAGGKRAPVRRRPGAFVEPGRVRRSAVEGAAGGDCRPRPHAAACSRSQPYARPRSLRSLSPPSCSASLGCDAAAPDARHTGSGESLADLTVPAGFDFATTRAVEVRLRALDTAGAPSRGRPRSTCSTRTARRLATGLTGRRRHARASRSPSRPTSDALVARPRYIGLPSEVALPVSGDAALATVGGVPPPARARRKTRPLAPASRGGFATLGGWDAAAACRTTSIPTATPSTPACWRRSTRACPRTRPSRRAPRVPRRGNETDVVARREEADVWVTFVHEGAGWRNALGYLHLRRLRAARRRSARSTTQTLVFPNASFAGSGGGLYTGDKVHLGRFPAGTAHRLVRRLERLERQTASGAAPTRSTRTRTSTPRPTPRGASTTCSCATPTASCSCSPSRTSAATAPRRLRRGLQRRRVLRHDEPRRGDRASATCPP